MKKVVTYIILTAFLFGTMEIALKIAGSTFDSIQLTFLRFLIGGLVLAPFGIAEVRKDHIRISGKELLWLLLVGIMGIAISMLAFQIGVQHCNAATAAALICLNPLFTMVIAHLFTSEKMDRAKGVAFAIGIVAAVFMIRPWDVQSGNTAFGMAMMLLASVTFAAYTVMGKRTIGRIGTFAQTSISFILGSSVLLIVMLMMKRPIVAHITEQPLVLLYCGIMVTGVGYLFYFLAIRYSDATTGSIAFFIKPAIAPVLSVLVLGEEIYWNTIVGILLLITASIITLRDTWKKEDPEIEETELEVKEGLEVE
jgi:drug/metabolite transporter (DMT)-like permease